MNRALLFILAFLVLVNVAVWLAVSRLAPTGFLKVAFLDIGQGDAIYIEAPNGNQVLLDGGPGKQILRQLGAVMPFYDHSLDLVIESHPDADHITGLIDVLNKYEVAHFMEPGVEASTAFYQTLKATVAKRGVPLTLARRGMRIILDKQHNIALEILFPDGDVTGWETNKASIVARLVDGNNAFLLTGDSPSDVEKYLISKDVTGKQLQANVLKAGHHGSKTSTAPEYVAAVQPKYGVISAGRDNKFGHPHPETLKTLRDAGVQVVSTAEEGTIIFTSDGQALTVCSASSIWCRS